MNKHEKQSQAQSNSAAQAKESFTKTLGGQIVGYFLFLVAWSVIGGIFIMGPRILSHGIENTVSEFVMNGTSITWIALPITMLFVMTIPSSKVLVALGVNIICCLLFLVAFYIQLFLA